MNALDKNEIEDDFLMNFSKLKEFHYEGDTNIYYVLKKQIQAYDKRLRIYHYGVCYSNNKPRNLIINYDHLLTENRVQFYLNRIGKLAASLPIINTIEFNERLYDKLSLNFLIKLNGIKLIKINESIEDENKLINFIKHSQSNVIKLHFICSKFSQQFYSQLRCLTPCLTEFKFNHFGLKNLNFNFLVDLKFLKEIVTINTFDLCELKKIIKHLKCLKHLEFKFRIANLSELNLKLIKHQTFYKLVLRDNVFKIS